MLRNLLLIALLCNIALSQVCTDSTSCLPKDYVSGPHTLKCCTTTTNLMGLATDVKSCLPIETQDSDNTVSLMGMTSGVKVSCNAKYILSSVMMVVLAVAAIFV